MRGINARESSRERLTSLGTMAAGLAHELNNPAAAARRAASELVDARCRSSTTRCESFVESGIERVDAEKLIALQKEALDRAENRGRPSSAIDESDADRRDGGHPRRAAGSSRATASPSRSASAGLDEDWVRRVQSPSPARARTRR